MKDQGVVTNLEQSEEYDSIDLSSTFVKVNYTVNGKVEMKEDEMGVPEFCGVILKDGTKVPYMGNGGMTGYTDDTMEDAYDLKTYDRVIDMDQVKSFILQ